MNAVEQAKNYPAVGFAEIDAEHAAIDLALEQLTEALRRDDARRAAASHATLVQMTAAHFANEERLMTKIGYRALARHRRAHRAFLLQARRNARHTGDAFLSATFIRWVTRISEWFRLHVVREDFWLGQAAAGRN